MDNLSLPDTEESLEVCVDDSKLTEQLDELFSNLKRPVSDVLFDDIQKLSLDLVFGDSAVALGTDGIRRYVIRPRFGLRYEALIAAVRAHKRI
jgi:hypothetical protein